MGENAEWMGNSRGTAGLLDVLEGLHALRDKLLEASDFGV